MQGSEVKNEISYTQIKFIKQRILKHDTYLNKIDVLCMFFKCSENIKFVVGKWGFKNTLLTYIMKKKWAD